MAGLRTIPLLIVAVAIVAAHGAYGRESDLPYLVEISNDSGTTAALVRDGRIITTLQRDYGYQAERARDRSLIAWIDNGLGALRVATPDGKRRAFVAGVQSFAWSPAGHRLLIAIDKGGRLKVLDPSSGRTTDVTPSPPPKSPNVVGWVEPDTIVYSQTSSDPHCDDLMAADVSGRHPRQLATVCTTGAFGGDYARLSPDGRRLLVISTLSGRPSYRIVDVTRGTRTAIASPAGAVSAFWGPDGRVGFVTRNGGRERIVAISLDGRSTKTLAALAPGEHAVPEFLTSPGGRRLAFIATTGTLNRVVTVGVNGEAPRTIGTSSGRRVFARCWFDDGRIALMTENGLRILETRDRRGAALREVFRTPRGVYLVLSCS